MNKSGWRSLTVAAWLKCMGHPLRVRILIWMFDTGKNKDIPSVPTMIAIELEESLSNVSYHLNKMYMGNILSRRISGRYTHYSVNKEELNLVKEFLNESK